MQPPVVVSLMITCSEDCPRRQQVGMRPSRAIADRCWICSSAKPPQATADSVGGPSARRTQAP
ncbi:hypothetical protein [Desulfosarcina cetonica]|uniref:hypothetical protein n=1 Tax=Desulfosarcina cetonica TaxID=90730 RepID=UPI00155D98D8|nr:hypothetical protein [Desulfosarcina cetonica]